MPGLTISVDTQEPRILTDRQTVLVTGHKEGRLQWDLLHSASIDVAVDNITGTAYIAPATIISQWETSFRTDFLIRKADTDKAASASWVEKHFRFDGNIYLHALGVNEVVTTTASFDKNMPWHLSYYAYGEGDSFSQFEVRFGTGSSQVNLLFYTDSRVLIYKNSVLLGVVNLQQGEAWDRAVRATEGGAVRNNQDQPIDIFILPCRRRDLLIYSSVAGGGHFVFDDIPKDDPNPTILPSGQVAFYVIEGQATFQAAPAKKAGAFDFFNPTATVVSKVQELRHAPPVGATPSSDAYYDLPYYDIAPTVTSSLVNEDGTTPFVGDGTKKKCRIKIAMTSNGFNTPFVYGAQAIFAATTLNTANSPIVIDELQIEGGLSVPESPADVAMEIVLKEVPTLDANLLKSKKLSNRPVAATIGGIAILTGRMRNPHWIDGPTNASQKLIFECQDRWKSFERKRIADPLPYDGMFLEDAIEELATTPGYSVADMDVEPFGLVLDSTGQAARGEWALIPQEGDTVAQWLLRLFDDYASTCVMGWYPSATGPKFRFRLPAEFGGSLSTTATATLYSTKAAAIAAGYTEATQYLGVYHDFDEVWLEPESNDLRVTGFDRRLDKFFQAHEQDASAQDPDLAVASRPDNWVGEPYEVAVWDPAITSQALANYAVGVLKYRLFSARRIAQWSCQMLGKADGSPIWRGDVVNLNGHGRYRVLAFHVDFVLENASRQIRNASYIGQYVGP